MNDSLPIEQYKANYAAMIDHEPIPYGDAKGLILVNTNIDFDLVLKRNIPKNLLEKYFIDPHQEDTGDLLDRSIEVGRDNEKETHRKSIDLGMEDLSEQLLSDTHKLFPIRESAGNKYEKQLSMSLDQVIGQFKVLKKSNASLKEDLAGEKTNNVQLQNQLKHLEKVNTSIREKLQKYKVLAEKNGDSVEKRIFLAESNSGSLEKTLRCKDERIERLETEIEVVNEEKDSLVRENDSKGKKLERIQSQVGEFEAEIDSLQTEKSCLKKELSTQKRVSQDRESEHSEVVDSLTDEVSKLKRVVSSLEKKVESTEETDQLKQEVTALKEDKSFLNRENTSLKGENTLLKREVSTLKEKIASLKQEIALLKGEISSPKEETPSSQDLEQRVESLKEQISLLQNGKKCAKKGRSSEQMMQDLISELQSVKTNPEPEDDFSEEEAQSIKQKLSFFLAQKQKTPEKELSPLKRQILSLFENPKENPKEHSAPPAPSVPPSNPDLFSEIESLKSYIEQLLTTKLKEIEFGNHDEARNEQLRQQVRELKEKLFLLKIRDHVRQEVEKTNVVKPAPPPSRSCSACRPATKQADDYHPVGSEEDSLLNALKTEIKQMRTDLSNLEEELASCGSNKKLSSRLKVVKKDLSQQLKTKIQHLSNMQEFFKANSRLPASKGTDSSFLSECESENEEGPTMEDTIDFLENGIFRGVA